MHARLPCPSPSPRACSNSCLLSRQCYPTISSSVDLFSYLQSFPASWSLPVSWFFTSGGQSIGASASASVLQMNIEGWFPLGLSHHSTKLHPSILQPCRWDPSRLRATGTALPLYPSSLEAHLFPSMLLDWGWKTSPVALVWPHALLFSFLGVYNSMLHRV